MHRVKLLNMVTVKLYTIAMIIYNLKYLIQALVLLIELQKKPM